VFYNSALQQVLSLASLLASISEICNKLHSYLTLSVHFFLGPPLARVPWMCRIKYADNDDSPFVQCDQNKINGYFLFLFFDNKYILLSWFVWGFTCWSIHPVIVMCIESRNSSAMRQHQHLQSAVETSRCTTLSKDKSHQYATSFGSHHRNTGQQLPVFISSYRLQASRN